MGDYDQQSFIRYLKRDRDGARDELVFANGEIRKLQERLAKSESRVAEYESPLCDTPDKCSDCGNGLLFSAREIGDGLCHVCGHKRLAVAQHEILASLMGWDASATEAKLQSEVDDLTAKLQAAEDKYHLAVGRFADMDAARCIELAAAKDKLAAAEARVAELSKPQWYWDDCCLDHAIAADEIGEYDDVGDIIKLRPIHELPTVYLLVDDELRMFATEEEAEAAKAGCELR